MAEFKAGSSLSPLLQDVKADAFLDYKTRPVLLSKSAGWRSAVFIIGVELSERFAFYGVSSNFISYLTGPLGQSKATAAKNVNSWNGVASFSPLLGAFIADSFLGRYRTIIIASSLYILALGLLTLSAELSSTPQFQVTLFFFSIYLLAFSQGGHKPCVQTFGADQFDVRDPEECKAKSSFFNWWCFGLAASVGISIPLLSYIQEYLSWGLGFGIPCISMVIALLIFLSGSKTYRFSVNSNSKNPFFRIGKVYVRAARNWISSVPAISTDVEADELGLIRVLKNIRKIIKYLHKAVLKRAGSEKENGACEIIDVEDAKVILGLVPIWLSCSIFGIIYAQISTFFTEQGKTMDLTIWPGFQMPAASFQVFVSITIVLFIPIYNNIFVPFTGSLTGNHSGITTLQRIGLGIFLSIATVVVAALVETKRLKTAFEKGLVDLPKATVPMSVFWLVPQYVLFGISDALVLVGLQEFFYDEVASDMKSLGLALAYSVPGVGNFLSVFLIYVIQKVTGGDDGWFCNNLNKAHLDYFYWLLTGLGTVSLIMYVYFTKSYMYRR